MSEAAQSMEEGFEEGLDPNAVQQAEEAANDDGGITDRELAEKLGWKPQGEYTGDKPWVDFDKFLEARNDNLELARVNNNRLRQLNRDQAKKLKRAEAVVEQLKNFEERAYQRALFDLKAEQKRAVEEGDTAAFDRLDKQIDDLRDERQKAQKVEPKQSDVDTQELFTEWLIDNPWYNGDKTKQAYADLQFQKLGGIEGYEGSPDELLAEVTERVNKRFAAKEQPTKKINPVGGANGMRVAPKGDATYGSLNAEEKQMAQNMVKMGIFKTVDDYAKELRKNG